MLLVQALGSDIRPLSGNEYQIGGPGSNRAIPRVTGFRAVGVERMIRDGGIKEATTIAALGLLWLKGLL